MVKGKTSKTLSPTAPSRLSRDAWLEQALEVFSREGEGKLRIDGICQALGVTKGSFYWHFESRTDFLGAMVEYWIEKFNRRVPETAEARGGSARDRLRSVFEVVTNENLGKYDAAFDAWASHEPGIGAKVRAVYAYRYEYVSSLFRELGFRGVGLETRTTAFLAFLKSESWVTGREGSRRSAKRMAAELEFFTGG